MHIALRTLTLAAALVVAAPFALRAESSPDAAPPAAAVPCPHAEGGTCCAECQEHQKEAAAAAPAETEGGGCPCMRAKREAAKKAAEADKKE